MAITISIQHTIGLNQVLNELRIELPSEVITVREIIEHRVRQEVERYNLKKTGFFYGLVQPSDTERALNGYRIAKAKDVDAEKQVYIALDAFNKNAYFVLVNGRQVETLEQEVKISVETPVRFVKLTPLVGG